MFRPVRSIAVATIVASAILFRAGAAGAQASVPAVVKDIRPGPEGASPSSLTRLGAGLLFFANDGTALGLYRTDGTAGTVRLKTFSAFVGEIEDVAGTAYFVASPASGATFFALWKSGGTAGTTVQVKALPGYPYELTAVGSRLFFGMAGALGDEELWTSDGTEAGTVLVKDIEPGSVGSFPKDLTSYGGKLYFSATTAAFGDELWTSDGTAEGTVLVKDLAPGPLESRPFYLTVAGGALYFTASTTGSGEELWKSDGTPGGTVLVKDIAPGSPSSSPYELTPVGTLLFFGASDASGDTELYRSDGTAAATVRVKDLVPGPTASNPGFLTDVGGTLYFSTTDFVGPDTLWKSDGTTGGTVRVADLPGAMNPLGDDAVAAVNGRLLFSAVDPTAGLELWQSDGTAAGTLRVADIRPGEDDSRPDLFEVVGDTLYFIADTATLGSELWKTQVTTGPITGPPVLVAPTAPIAVGASNTLSGFAISPGTVVKLFVATASGTVSHGPFPATATTTSSLTFTVPSTVPLGNGFASLQAVATDRGYLESNVVGAHLAGSVAAGLPTIQQINGVALAPPSLSIGLAHIDTVVAKGATVTIAGTGFGNPLVNLFTAAGNVGPLTPLPGGTATQIQVVVPASAPTGPGNFQVVNRPSFSASNAVAAVIGARPAITSVTQASGTVTVNGAGFSSLSVINLYNAQGGGVVNLGGLAAGGAARVPLTIVSDTRLTFTRPAGAVAGAAFVEVLNPPFTPFSSSGNDPDGAFTFPAPLPVLTREVAPDVSRPAGGLPGADGAAPSSAAPVGGGGSTGGVAGGDARTGFPGARPAELVTWDQNIGTATELVGTLVGRGAERGPGSARSTRALVAGDGDLSWRAAAGPAVVGFGSGESGPGSADIAFGLGVDGATGELFVSERGVRVATLGTVRRTDRLRVRVRAGTVEYWSGGDLRWVSLSEPTYPLVARASLETGGRVTGARLAGRLADVVRWRPAPGTAREPVEAGPGPAPVRLEGPVAQPGAAVAARMARGGAIGFGTAATPDCTYCLVAGDGAVEVRHAGASRGAWAVSRLATLRVETRRDGTVRYLADEVEIDRAPRTDNGAIVVRGWMAAPGSGLAEVVLEAPGRR